MAERLFIPRVGVCEASGCKKRCGESLLVRRSGAPTALRYSYDALFRLFS